MLTIESHLSDPTGAKLVSLPDLVSLKATWMANRIGSVVARYPLDTALRRHLHRDNILQLWVGPQNGKKQLFTYFTRGWEFSFAQGKQYLEISGPDQHDLFRRRIVAHFAGSSQASMTDQADDMLKEIFDDAFANGTNPSPTYGSRVISNLSREALLTQGPSITKGFSFDKLLDRSGGGLFPAICQQAYAEDGTLLFFEIRPAGLGAEAIEFVFRTAIGQPHRDRSSTFILDENSSALTDAKLSYNYQDEENYIYAGGSGEEELREVVQVYDATEIAASIYNRCEGFEDQTSLTGSELTAAADTRLAEGRGTMKLVGSLVSTELQTFGREWNFGDRIGLILGPISGSVVISSGVIDVKAGNVKVTAKFEGETYV